MAMSKTQIDKLGERLKAGAHSEADLRMLDEYRQSFAATYSVVIQTLHQLGLAPTGRPAKTTHSIAEKLRRESIRLSQIQDIAGCRVVVKDVSEQDRVVILLTDAFPEAQVVDRRNNTSHGYRAVHVVAEIAGKPIEIQVRSTLQHLWAELSEKASDVLDPTIKYGGGPDEFRTELVLTSQLVATYEGVEATQPMRRATLERMRRSTDKMVADELSNGKPLETQAIRTELFREMALADKDQKEMEEELADLRGKLHDQLKEMILSLDASWRRRQKL